MNTPTIINRLKWKAYLIFMATNLAFIPIIYFFYPETSNLTLEEVDYIFDRGENAMEAAREMQKEVAREGRLDVERSFGGKTEPGAFVYGIEKTVGTVEHARP